MKVVAFNGSGRKDGNTAILINRVFRKLNDAGIETELVQLAGKVLRGCTACGWCIQNKVGKCVIEEDDLNSHLQKMRTADGIIIGSPTYFADISAETKALIDRTGFVSMSNGGLLTRKIGAAVIAVRRGGAVHAFDSINHFFLINQMIIPGSRYWNFGVGRGIGEVKDDEEGMLTMDVLGENMAWLMKKLKN
jgi:multimeric flavodoxin WrbA